MTLDLHQLPPLKSIEAFVVAARADSFTQASDQLDISVSALSRRIKRLEQYLGKILFIRGKTRVRLTEVGEAYLEEAERALTILMAARKTINASNVQQVNITAPHIFVKMFISPYLAQFEERHPEIGLSFDTNPHVYDLRHSDVDIAIRFGINWPGFLMKTLFLMSGGPACAPRLAYGEDIPRRVEALHRHTLLHFRQEPHGWARFFAAAGCKGLKGAADRYFDDADLLFAAACQGLGIALVDSVLHKDLLEPGHLIRPIDIEIATGDGFHLVFAPDAESKPAVLCFCDWLMSLPEIQYFRIRQKAFEDKIVTLR